ncbi:ammonium transporter [Benzoatithermus flavus]|uniref:Ammonium transporter n=1 Tax=Benzoatithermus flavus TaxID=3108223 RepID=A0ABU8XM77_9PROT
MTRTFHQAFVLPSLLLLSTAGAALAQQAADAPAAPPAIDPGHTAWMITATALVLMMSIPGLALFYGGMVRKKNVLSVLMQVFATTAVVSLVWVVAGYSLAFTDGSPWIGDLGRLLLRGLSLDSRPVSLQTVTAGTPVFSGVIPESVFMMFQMTFAAITPALIVGAFVDRMKFGPMVLFMTLWSVVVYAPIAHWVWSPNGFLFGEGVLDYAGGTVVHINAGIAGLVACLILGKRIGFGSEPMAPHNLTLTVMGASLLWVGWFGFNAGSAVASDGRAGMAMAVTHIAAAAAAVSWMLAEWVMKGKPSVLGIASGAVAGLVAITPASGFVLPNGALVIGLLAGIVCYWGATGLKHMMGYDDSLDVFGVHGVGGILGALLTGVFATSEVGGSAVKGLIDGNPLQVWIQLKGIAWTIGWCAVASFVLLKALDLLMGLRVDKDSEREGLDLALHGETVA